MVLDVWRGVIDGRGSCERDEAELGRAEDPVPEDVAEGRRVKVSASL